MLRRTNLLAYTWGMFNYKVWASSNTLIVLLPNKSPMGNHGTSRRPTHTHTHTNVSPLLEVKETELSSFKEKSEANQPGFYEPRGSWVDCSVISDLVEDEPSSSSPSIPYLPRNHQYKDPPLIPPEIVTSRQARTNLFRLFCSANDFFFHPHNHCKSFWFIQTAHHCYSSCLFCSSNDNVFTIRHRRWRWLSPRYRCWSFASSSKIWVLCMEVWPVVPPMLSVWHFLTPPMALSPSNWTNGMIRCHQESPQGIVVSAQWQ